MGEDIKVKRTWRDNIFRYLFKDEENFVEMYEAFTGKKLLPDEIEFRNTDSIVMSKDLKNDVAFITKDGNFICLVEHQSTKCPNIALRLLIYYGELLKMHVQRHGLNIYGTVPIEYPKAEFFVAYNGKDNWACDDCIVAGDVTINVRIVNINYDELEIPKNDNVLSGYAYLVRQIEYYTARGLLLGYAADMALEDCRRGGYLADYVDKEEFLTMVVEVWTIEQQAADRERWAREEERAKAEAERIEERAKAEAELSRAQEERIKAEKQLKSDKLEIAKNLIASNVSIDIIASSTQLPKADIINLKSEL